MTDTGIGINEECQKKIFEAFGKLKDKDGLNEHGCGLGLTICRKIAESMGGKITLQSTFNVGSTFSFYFKLNNHLN